LQKRQKQPFASPPYYKKEHEDEELEEIAQNFEPHMWLNKKS
jgi:hypothetical protein